MLLIFDVDGTLTPSRGRIDEQFRLWLLNNLKKDFVLVTGSDPAKTREQIGDELYNSTVVYNCSGNHIFKYGKEFYRSDWTLPSDLEQFLEQKLQESQWSIKTGKHIEKRVGLCNFSIVGRNATLEERKAYYEYDCVEGERLRVAAEIRSKWSDIEVGVAGETGLDISKRGCGKSQIVDHESIQQPLHFFGDRMDKAGNDYSLAKAIWDNKLGICYHVKNWQETWSILRGLNG